MPVQHVLINDSTGTIKVSPATVHASRKNRDKVLWMGTSHFEITFDPISPFGTDHFDSSPCKTKWSRVNKKGSTARGGYIECAESGSIDPDAALGEYKYSVKMGSAVLDPGVHVDP